ncbi:hypothetical protein ACFPIJ_58105 [Dactylosporangium cerinum]|uniref:Secreted protein n=1 Tax=Dactylosporangium cerinum TaxID=1434730 RepID=A0ABV9WFK2_9ACTN
MKAHLLAALALTASAAISITMAGPAQAVDAGGPVIVDRSTSWNSDDYKTKEAYCPDNTYVIGTGAFGAGTDNMVDDLIPFSGHVYGKLWEDENGTNANSQLTVRAVCADVDGYEIVSGTSPDDSVSPKSAVAHCSNSSLDLLGTGFEVRDGFGQVTVTKVVPYADDAPSTDSVTVTAHEDDTSIGTNWTITAYAICGYAAGPTTIESSNTSYSTASPKGKSQTCPVDRFNTGAGAATSNATVGNIHLSPFMPGSHYGVEDLMNATAYTDDDGTNPSTAWYLTLHAICVLL